MSNSFEIQWTVTHQTLLSIGFPRQEYWSRCPFPSSGDLPVPGTESMSPATAGGFITTEPPGKPDSIVNIVSLSAMNHPVSSQMFSFSSLFNSLNFNITWAQSKFSRRQHVLSLNSASIDFLTSLVSITLGCCEYWMK